LANIPDQYKPILAKLNHLWVANFGDIMFPKESISVINTRTQQVGSVVLGGYAWYSNNNFNGGRTEETSANLMPVIEAGLGASTFINITGDENGVTVTYSDNIPSTSVQYNYSKYNGAYDLGYIPYEGQSIAKPTTFNSLSDCMDYILSHWAGVTIRVNNEVWLVWDDPCNPIDYNWQSVPSISGKNGILSLGHVLDDSILTGSDISNIGLDAVSLPSSAKFANMMANVPHGTKEPIIYAGSVDHLDAKWSAFIGGGYDLYLNIAGSEVYTITQFATDSDYIGFIIDDENEVAKIVKFTPHTEASIQTGWDLNVSSDDATNMHNVWLFIHSHRSEDDNPEINEADPGTDPTYQQDVSVTGISKPSYGAIDTGFSKMYRMSDTQLKSLSNFLWSNSFVDIVTKFFNDPREIIVGLSIMPVVPTTGSSEEVKAGGISTGVYGLPLTDQYVFDTYGYAEVKAEKGNFLDYNPFTKVTAHLPFVGEHSLDVNDVVGKQLTLKYIFDFLTGSCVAEIDVNGKPRYFFGGACGMQVPTSSEDFGRMYSSILSAGATLGGTLATIATGGLTAPLAIGAASSMLANGMNGSPTVQFSSGSGSVNGMIGCKTAFLVIEKPKEKIVGSQQKYLGRPSFMLRTLSDCDGYTKCLNVHLDNVPCTATERAEIERLLLDGVRIKAGSTTPTYTPTTASDHGLIFLKCTSDMDVIGKSWDEEDELTVEGKLLFDQDMLTPKFVLQADTLAYNYCYIPDFGRFYYVTKQLIKTGSMTEIHLQCDVLQSWKTQILSNKAVIERSADNDNVNMYFSDNMYWTQANKEVKTVPFTKANGEELVFEIPDDNYILTIAGGS
jgi:hypothetical protein